MKWVLGTLLTLNLLVFLLVIFANDSQQTPESANQVPAGVMSIELLSGTTDRVDDNCTNLGPIEQEFIISTIMQKLAEQNIDARPITEASRNVTAFRVIIKPDDSDHLDRIISQLEDSGIRNYYKTTTDSGGPLLSLGVFTYEKTAKNLVDSLRSYDLDASHQREKLLYPARFWINLDSQLKEEKLAQIALESGIDSLEQSAASCVSS